MISRGCSIPPGGYVQNANNPPWWTNLRAPIDPADYPRVLTALADPSTLADLRRVLAGKVFAHTADYDAAIASHQRFLQLSPGLAETFWSLNGIARAHLAAGRIEEALAWGLRGAWPDRVRPSR